MKSGIWLVVASAALVACMRAPVAETQKSTPELIQGFHNWKKVNPTPIKTPIGFEGLCRAAPPPWIVKSSHSDCFIDVYVNQLGENAMKTRGTFPVGSVIVKAKRTEAKTPATLATVMTKQPKGYFPAGGDWMYSEVDLSTKKLVGEGKLEQCSSCHLRKDGTDTHDFVFGTSFYVEKKFFVPL